MLWYFCGFLPDGSSPRSVGPSLGQVDNDVKQKTCKYFQTYLPSTRSTWAWTGVRSKLANFLVLRLVIQVQRNVASSLSILARKWYGWGKFLHCPASDIVIYKVDNSFPQHWDVGSTNPSVLGMWGNCSALADNLNIANDHFCIDIWEAIRSQCKQGIRAALAAHPGWLERGIPGWGWSVLIWSHLVLYQLDYLAHMLHRKPPPSYDDNCYFQPVLLLLITVNQKSFNLYRFALFKTPEIIIMLRYCSYSIV